MKQLLGGLALGALLGAGGLYAYQTYVLAPAGDCAGLCGDQTRCDQGRCVLAEAPVEPEPEPAVEQPKGKRKGKRGRRDSTGDEPALEPGKGPALDDDSGIPRFDAKKDQTIGAGDGSDRLSDAAIDRELGKLDGALQGCVRDANARVDELGTGTVKYSFGVAKTGKVTGVNVSAPDNLEQAGIAPCVRKVVYGHKFPSFDGPETKASSSFTVR